MIVTGHFSQALWHWTVGLLDNHKILTARLGLPDRISQKKVRTIISIHLSLALSWNVRHRSSKSSNKSILVDLLYLFLIRQRRLWWYKTFWRYLRHFEGSWSELSPLIDLLNLFIIRQRHLWRYKTFWRCLRHFDGWWSEISPLIDLLNLFIIRQQRLSRYKTFWRCVRPRSSNASAHHPTRNSHWEVYTRDNVEYFISVQLLYLWI